MKSEVYQFIKNEVDLIPPKENKQQFTKANPEKQLKLFFFL